MVSSAIWSVFGGILGLLCGLLENHDIRHDAVRNIAAGAVGGAIGGFLGDWNATLAAHTFGTAATASVGAIGLSATVSWFARGGFRRVHRARDVTP